MTTRQTAHRFAFPLALAIAAGSAAPVMAQVLWRSPVAPAFAPDKQSEPLLAQLAQEGGTRHLALQLARPVTDADRAALSAAGLTIASPLGNNAFFASIDAAKLNIKAVQSTGLISGAQAIDPAWKLHGAFAANDPTAFTVVGTAPASARSGKPDSIVAMYVLMHADAPRTGNAEALIEKHGGIVRDRIETLNGLVVELPLSAASTLASEDAVQWIEPALPLLTPTNAENRALTRSNQVQAAPYNLNGAGVTALVYDGGGVRASHQDFGGRATVIDGSSGATHATHVAGTIGGSGAASGGNNRGMAPGVTILSAALSAGSGFLYTNPGDIEADYAAAFNQGADITNNSIGTNVNNNGFSCTWHGDYGITDGVIDAIVRGMPSVTDGQPFRVVWAAGNERGGRCDVAGGYRTIGPPGGAKNHLSVGAVNANNDSMTNFSGWGPTDDGRLKPDFCAPGCQSGGDSGVTSCSNSSDSSYSSLCGTSMASPTATGIAALMLQDWANLFPGSPWPRNSTLKVLLAQSAVDLGTVGPDYTFGYGSIRADSAIDLMRTGAFQEGSLSQNFTDIYTVTVAPGSGPLVFTVAWDDAPATANVIPSLINNLDLRVFAPSGTRHYPWTLNPANPSSAAVRTQEDQLNNIEQVFVNAPIAGVWTIEVRGSNVPAGPQPYSVVSSNTSFALTGSVSIALEPITLAPESILAGIATPLSVLVDIQGDTVAPGSVQMFYRTSGGPFTAVPMTDAGGGVFVTNLPSVDCGASPEYYFSAQGAQLGTVLLPLSGAINPFTTIVGEFEITDFDMETAAGWIGGQPGDTATSGQWESGVPEQTAAQPGADHTPDPGVNCWVTGRQAGSGVGSFDVDGGFTTLLSSSFDLSAATGATRIGYWRWYSNIAGAAPNADVFTIDISSNGGTNWTNVEVVGPTGPQTAGGWFYHEFRVADLVPLTSNVRLRFIASDLGAGSIVEAAIDDLSIIAVQCSEPCAADFDGNSAVEVPDIFAFLSAWFAQDPSADLDGVPGIAVPDIFAFLSLWFAGC